MVLNLHEVVATQLDFINPIVTATFTKKSVVWSTSSRTPTETTTTVSIPLQIQPASLQEIVQLGIEVSSYQYYKIYASLNATYVDKLRQLASDTFTIGVNTYKIVSKSDWFTTLDNEGWTEGFCYLCNVADSDEENDSNSNNVDNDSNNSDNA